MKGKELYNDSCYRMGEKKNINSHTITYIYGRSNKKILLELEWQKRCSLLNKSDLADQLTTFGALYSYVYKSGSFSRF